MARCLGRLSRDVAQRSMLLTAADRKGGGLGNSIDHVPITPFGACHGASNRNRVSSGGDCRNRACPGWIREPGRLRRGARSRWRSRGSSRSRVGGMLVAALPAFRFPGVGGRRGVRKSSTGHLWASFSRASGRKCADRPRGGPGARYRLGGGLGPGLGGVLGDLVCIWAGSPAASWREWAGFAARWPRAGVSPSFGWFGSSPGGVRAFLGHSRAFLRGGAGRRRGLRTSCARRRRGRARRRRAPLLAAGNLVRSCGRVVLLESEAAGSLPLMVADTGRQRRHRVARPPGELVMGWAWVCCRWGSAACAVRAGASPCLSGRPLSICSGWAGLHGLDLAGYLVSAWLPAS